MDTNQTINTLTQGELRIGEKLIDPTNGEIKYPLRNDTHTIMFVTEAVLRRMLQSKE